MKPLRYRSAPLGEQITSTPLQNAKSKVVQATKNTWIAGAAEADATTHVVYTDPYTLTPQDLYSWPMIVNITLYGLVEGFSSTEGFNTTFTILATTPDKELPVANTGSLIYPTSNASKQSAGTTIHNHTTNTAAFAPSNTDRRFLWKFDAELAIISAQVENEKANVGDADYGTMQWRQITHSSLILNSNASPTFGISQGDASTTVVAHANYPECLSSSAFDCTNGMKFVVGCRYAGNSNPRLLMLGGVIHCSPEENRTPTLLGNLSL